MAVTYDCSKRNKLIRETLPVMPGAQHKILHKDILAIPLNFHKELFPLTGYKNVSK
jgi:hypothetical protein